jgi:hypothetical protein
MVCRNFTGTNAGVLEFWSSATLSTPWHGFSMIKTEEANGAGIPPHRRATGEKIAPCFSTLDMAYKKEAIRCLPALQHVAGLVRKNIDVGERIGACEGQPVALRQPAEHTSKGQFRPRKSRSIEEHPNLIFGGALNFGLREGNGCGLQVPEGAAGICGGCL